MKKETKILVVDDSQGWREYHQKALRRFYGEDFIIDTANSGREGYDAVYNNINKPYDIIISDLQMEWDFEPKHAGEWFVEQVQMLNEYKKTKIIIMSASYNVRSVANRLGVDCLPKAVAANDLAAYKLAIEELMTY